MKKIEVLAYLGKVARAKSEGAAEINSFYADMNTIMHRLLHEAARNYMSPEEVAKASGFTTKRVRQMMRDVGLNPRDGKNLLQRKAAEALANNAALLGIEPSEMDLMSPLAYLPMGSEMKRELQDATISKVEESEISGNDEYERLVNVIYDAMPWEGETYQAAAESIANAVVKAGW